MILYSTAVCIQIVIGGFFLYKSTYIFKYIDITTIEIVPLLPYVGNFLYNCAIDFPYFHAAMVMWKLYIPIYSLQVTLGGRNFANLDDDTTATDWTL